MYSFKTNYGVINGVTNFMTHKDGQLKSCILNSENRINTPVGEIIPLYKGAELGERQKKYRSSLSFFKNGQIKSVALDQQMPIQTPLASWDAELVTFYEDGSINRLFPLNGKIDGFWSEDNEGELAEKLNFDLAVGSFSAKIIGSHFYSGGALKSLTLWPGEKIAIQTPLGEMLVRTGFSLYEDGRLKSVEPARPTRLTTPIGDILAFDTEVLGLHADVNSVQFSETGDLLSVKTVNSGVCVTDQNGLQGRIEPLEVESLIDETETRMIPLKIDFEEKEIIVTDLKTRVFDRSIHQFASFNRKAFVPVACSSCSSCSEGCNSCG